jgi:hypothetical protein
MYGGLAKACGIGLGVLLIVVGTTRAVARKGPEERVPYSRDPNAGFKSPMIFWVSVGLNFAFGLAIMALALWVI